MAMTPNQFTPTCAEDFKLEPPKEVDAANKPTETKTEPEQELWPERLI